MTVPEEVIVGEARSNLIISHRRSSRITKYPTAVAPLSTFASKKFRMRTTS